MQDLILTHANVVWKKDCKYTVLWKFAKLMLKKYCSFVRCSEKH